MKIAGRCLIIFFLLTGFTFAQDNAAKQAEDLPRYMEVTASVGTGAQMTDAGVKQLSEKGYNAVINLRTATEGVDLEVEQKAVEAAGMAYYSVPISGKEPDPAQAEKFLDLMKMLSGKRVFVHCASANRAGSLVMIKRVLQDGLSIDDATAEAARIGLHSDTLKQFALDAIARLQNKP